MKRLLLSLALVALGFQTQGVPIFNQATLSGEYKVTVTTTPIDSDSWQFSYLVENIDQYRGLDGFSVQTPLGATIGSIVVPDPYVLNGGWWDSGVDANRVFWTWGQQEGSVYPIGTSATFGFVADGVTVGLVDALITTYNGPGVYTQFSTRLQGPVGVPDGGTTLALLGLSLTGLGLIRSRFGR